MLFKYDKVPYKTKATGMEIGKIQNRIKIADQEEISIDKLVKIIEQGHSFYLCQFKEKNSVSINNVLGTEYLAIDVDNKEHITTLEEAIELIKTNFNVLPELSYFTFSSSTDIPKFRLIYKLDKFVTPEEFKKIYNVLILALNKKYEVIDAQASNINRLWSGTNKAATVYDDSIPFNTDEIISKLPKISERKKAPKIDKDTSCFKYGNYYIKDKEAIMEQLKNEIDIKNYLETHFGVRIKNNRCACPIHGGDNKSALAVYNDTCHCFTHCGTLNIISLAREYYHINDFNEVALRLIQEHNIMINENSIGRKR